jgi:cysteinyl-tRNA synthetase
VARLRAATTPRPSGEGDGEPADLARARTGAVERFTSAMDDDFNTSQALAELQGLAREINRAREAGVGPNGIAAAQQALLRLAGVLGLTLEEPRQDLGAKPFVELLLAVRQQLRGTKQYALADQIRADLLRLGVAIEDRPDGSTWHVVRPDG